MTLSEIEVGNWFVYRGKIYSKGNGVIMALGQFLVNCEILGELCEGGVDWCEDYDSAYIPQDAEVRLYEEVYR